MIGDGNCLFRACTKAITGDQTLQSVLRILTCLEPYNHAEFCAYPRYKEEWKSPECSFRKEDSIFHSFSVSENRFKKLYNLGYKATDDRKMCVKKEAEFVCSLGE